MPTTSPPPTNPTVGQVRASGYANVSEWKAATTTSSSVIQNASSVTRVGSNSSGTPIYEYQTPSGSWTQTTTPPSVATPDLTVRVASGTAKPGDIIAAGYYAESTTGQVKPITAEQTTVYRTGLSGKEVSYDAGRTWVSAEPRPKKVSEGKVNYGSGVYEAGQQPPMPVKVVPTQKVTYEGGVERPVYSGFGVIDIYDSATGIKVGSPSELISQANLYAKIAREETVPKGSISQLKVFEGLAPEVYLYRGSEQKPYGTFTLGKQGEYTYYGEVEKRIFGTPVLVEGKKYSSLEVSKITEQNIASTQYSASLSKVTPEDLVLYYGVAKAGVAGLRLGTTAISKTLAPKLAPNLVEIQEYAPTGAIAQGVYKYVPGGGYLNQAYAKAAAAIGSFGEKGALNIGTKSIYSGGASQTLSTIGQTAKTAITSPIGKEAVRFIGTQAASQGLYYTSSQTVPTVRNLYASSNKEYKQQQDVINVISEGYGLGYVRTKGGQVPLVDEAGQPILNEKGQQQYQTYAPTITNPFESFLVETIAPTQAISFGKGGLFGTGFFSEETREARIAAIKEKVIQTKSYKEAVNKEAFLNEVINTEFFGAQVGAALAIPQYEIASELGISSLGKYVTPSVMKTLPGRAGLAASMAIITPAYGGFEGLTTTRVQAESMRMKLTRGQELSAIGQGVIMATAINVATGATFFKAKSPYPKGNTPLNKAIYYGAKGIGYGYDLPELFIDKALEKTGIKLFTGSISVPTTSFAGAPSAGSIIQVKAPSSRSEISLPSNQQDIIKSQGDTQDIIKSQGDTQDIIKSQGDTINNYNNVINNPPTTSQTTINTFLNTSTSTSTTTNVSTIVSPFVPMFPFFGLPEGTAFSGAGTKKGKTKYYNELLKAIGSFKGLDFAFKPSKRKGKRKVKVGGKLYYLGKRVRSKKK